MFFFKEEDFEVGAQLLGDFGEFLYKFPKKHNLVTWQCTMYLIYAKSIF